MNPDRNSSREDDESLRKAVRELLLSRGFQRIGFASARETPGAHRFREWVSRGLHGEMEYLARNIERRCDARAVLPGARSVVVVALHYDRGSDRRSGSGPAEAGRATISAYARGTDYHRILEKRLKDACRELRAMSPEDRFRYYVDTGPVLEKAWAERAGVGWIGKNACSIDRDAGSYFFLGAILTTLDLPPDEPAADHCGSCRLCLDACPTEAFAAPYVLDARRCISYLTIEKRGGLEPELEGDMANLVFGCDICQDVCPWNRGTRAPGDPELASRAENVSPSLDELALLDPEEFRERFPRSAVRRAGWRGFLRNVAVALGNSGERKHLELLDAMARRSYVREEPALLETIERARARLAIQAP